MAHRRGRSVFRGKSRGRNAIINTIMRGVTPAWTRNIRRVIRGKGRRGGKGQSGGLTPWVEKINNMQAMNCTNRE